MTIEAPADSDKQMKQAVKKGAKKLFKNLL
jgi:hypothetical protein